MQSYVDNKESADEYGLGVEEAFLKAPSETTVNATAAAEIPFAKTKQIGSQGTTENIDAGNVRQPVTKKKKSDPPKQEPRDGLSGTKRPQHTKYLNKKEANALLIDSGEAISKALKDLEKARAASCR